MYKNKQYYFYKPKNAKKYTRVPVGEFKLGLLHGVDLPPDATECSLTSDMYDTVQSLDSLDERRLN